MYEKLGLRESDVIIDKQQSVNGTVNVPEETTLDIGTLLSTADGGKTWTSDKEDPWVAGLYAENAIVYHNGHTWKSLAKDNSVEPGSDALSWEDQGAWDANGVLVEGLETTADANVLTMGYVYQNNLTGFEEGLRMQLFKNKIITK